MVMENSQDYWTITFHNVNDQLGVYLDYNLLSGKRIADDIHQYAIHKDLEECSIRFPIGISHSNDYQYYLKISNIGILQIEFPENYPELPPCCWPTLPNICQIQMIMNLTIISSWNYRKRFHEIVEEILNSSATLKLDPEPLCTDPEISKMCFNFYRTYLYHNVTYLKKATRYLVGILKRNGSKDLKNFQRILFSLICPLVEKYFHGFNILDENSWTKLSDYLDLLRVLDTIPEFSIFERSNILSEVLKVDREIQNYPLDKSPFEWEKNIFQKFSNYVQNIYRKLARLPQIQEIYVRRLGSYTFLTNTKIKPDDHNIKLNIRTLSRIVQELITIKNNIYTKFEGSVFYCYNPQDISCHHFLIMGHQGTPYDSGCFEFSLEFTNDYPEKPPIICSFLPIDSKKLEQFSPIYHGADICHFFIPYTNSNKFYNWIPEKSGIWQIIITVANIILGENPFQIIENKPDADRLKKMLRKINILNIKYGIIHQIMEPPTYFQDVVREHFRIKLDYIKTYYYHKIKEYIQETPSKKCKYDNIYNRMCNALDTLK